MPLVVILSAVTKIGENQFNALRDINIHHHATPAPSPTSRPDEWPHSYLAEIIQMPPGEHGHRPPRPSARRAELSASSPALM
ncbi:MAG: hypothetical protein IPL28_05830 [Chloroflexi bacterium]|nr:hypothetical protein [Chloroflexota bacterium]